MNEIVHINDLRQIVRFPIGHPSGTPGQHKVPIAQDDGDHGNGREQEGQILHPWVCKEIRPKEGKIYLP